MNVFFVFLMILLNMIISSICHALENQSLKESASQKSQINIIWLVEDKKENLDLLAKNSPNTSVASYIESRIIAKLTQYNIELKRVSIKRLDYLLQTNNNACVANRAKLLSRQAYSLFSSPQAFYLTHKLFRFEQNEPLPQSLLSEAGEVISLRHVFEYFPGEKIAIAEGVSFGQYLDNEIAQLNRRNIYFRGGANRVVALEAMLYAKRADFLLALPIDMNPSKVQKLKLEQYAIKDAPPYLIAHFSCSKSEVGKQVISDINGLLAKMYHSDDYYLAHEKWFGKQEILKLQQYLNEKFLQEQFLKSK